MNWEDILKRDIQFRVTKQQLYHIFVDCLVEGGVFRGLREHINNMRLRTTEWKTEPSTEPRSEVVGPENFLLRFKHTTEELNNPISYIGFNETMYLEEMWLQGYGGNKQMLLNEGETVFVMEMFKDEYPNIYHRMMRLIAQTMRIHDLEMENEKFQPYYEE